MKSKVHFSKYCIIVTAGVTGLLIAGTVMKAVEGEAILLPVAITAIILVAGLYYCPVEVEAGADALRLRRLLSGWKRFDYSDIAEIDTCYPSAVGIRLCGSGGYFGYWGWFSDITIGGYFGYYADRDQCFFIRLKSGRVYVLSCDSHTALVKAVRARLR